MNTRLNCFNDDKRDFLAVLDGVRKQAFKPRTIRAGFAQTGINPWNPSIVTNELEKHCTEPPPAEFLDGSPTGHCARGATHSPGNTPSKSTTTTGSSASPPNTLEELRTSIDKAEKNLNQINDLRADTAKLKKRLNRIFQGSLTQAELNAQQEDRLGDLLNANRQKTTKKSKRHVQAGGVLSIKDANQQIESRRAEEIRKEWAQQERRECEARVLGASSTAGYSKNGQENMPP